MKSLTDFADGFSPMLVKELRQGVRSRMFVYTLLFLQGTLMLLAIMGLLASDARQNTDDVTAYFWIAAGAFLILFLPLGGFNAVSSERTSNTLELIFMTRLSARRIVAGKWLAIVSQIVLLVFTILPYIVLRYFLGGVDLWFELQVVGGLLLGSAVLSAITVGFSPLPAILSRIALVVGLLFGLYFLAFTVATMRISRVMVGRGPRVLSTVSTAWKDYTAAGLAAVLIVLLMLEFGASRIAPPAENHSSPLRLIGLGAIVVGIILDHFFFQWGGTASLVAFCFALPILIGALCESPRLIGNIYRPFVRGGFLGRAAGRFLYPGWPSATPYVLLMAAAFGVEFYFQSPAAHRLETALQVLIVAGTLLLPAAIMRLFGKYLRYPFAMYVGLQTIFVLLYSMASILVEYKHWDLHPILNAIPTCALLDMIFGPVQNVLLGLSVVGPPTAFSVILLLCLSLGPWRNIQALEKKLKLAKDREGVSVQATAAASPTA